MDPNKDFIHIDDVFKNLRDGEERERSGAWLNMKGLLDAEMPVGGAVSGGRSVRRYIIPALALLLLGGGATWWKVSNNKQDAALTETSRPAATTNGTDKNAPLYTGNANSGGKSTDGSATTQPATSGNAGQAAHTATASGRGSNNRLAAASGPGKHTATGTSGSNTANHAGNPATGNKTSGTHGSSPAAATTAAATTQKATATHAANTKNTTATKGNNTTPGGSNNSNGNALAAATTTPAKATQQKATGTGTLAANESLATEAAKAPVLKRQQVVEMIKPKESNNTPALAAATEKAEQPGNNNNGSNNTTAQQQVWKTTAVVNNQKIVQSPDGNYYKEERDTFKRIDLVERYAYHSSNTGGRNTPPKLTIDTVAITRIENVRYVPLTRMDLMALKKLNVNIEIKELVPLAKLKASTIAREHVNMVPLSNYKVASRRVDPSSFNKLIQNTAGGLAGYFDGSRNFYAAVMVGGNASFGNTGAFGMQIGVAGLLALSERWTLVAELKYMNHYFSNYSLQDQSVSYDVSKTQSGSGWLFSGNELTTSSVYKINSYGSIHMPVLMSYNLGRVSIFGGLDLAYAFPLSWEKRTNTNISFVESQQQQDKNPYQNKSFLYDEQNDFSSRFGLGYALGMNYDISRKISIDARMTQILTDNARGNIDAINKLFRQPSLQLSLGYYFGRKDKVVYIMDKR